MEASQATTARAKKEVEQEKGLVSEAEKVKSNVLNDVAILCGWVTVSGTIEAGLRK